MKCFIGRIAVICIVILLWGCHKEGNEWDYGYPSEPPPGSQNEIEPAGHYDIANEVEHVHYDIGEHPVDVYSVVIFKNESDAIKLSKHVSQQDKYYYLTLTYVGMDGGLMRGDVVIDVDGFMSDYRDNEPYRSVSAGGAMTQMVTVILNRFVVNDMQSAVNLKIEYKFRPPIAITTMGIENIGRLISETENN